MKLIRQLLTFEASLGLIVALADSFVDLQSLNRINNEKLGLRIPIGQCDALNALELIVLPLTLGDFLGFCKERS